MPTTTPISTGISAADVLQLRDTAHEITFYNELIRILWGGTWYYYANAAFEEFPFDRIFTRVAGLTTINVRLEKDWFADYTIGTMVDDDTTSFEFWDGDNHFRDKHREFGEGARIEIYGFWPTITAANANGMLLLRWWGLLGQPDKSTPQIFKVKAKAGMRSPKLNLPRRQIYPGCPLVFGGEVNPATGTPFLGTQALINEHHCPYNKHIGGGIGTPGVTHCKRDSLATCTANLGSATLAKQYYGGFGEMGAGSLVITQGRTWFANTEGNPSVVRKAIGVTYGRAFVGDIEPLIFQDQAHGAPNGYIRAVWIASEGPIQDGSVGTNDVDNPDHRDHGLAYIKVADKYVIPDHSLNFVGNVPAVYTMAGFTSIAYSGTAYFITDLLQSDFQNWNATVARASCVMNGRIIRVYSTSVGYPDAGYTEQFTTNRAWVLFDLLTNKVYGLGLDRDLFVIDDWLALANWCDDQEPLNDLPGEAIQFVPFPGDGGGGGGDGGGGGGGPFDTTFTRSTFNGHIREKQAQEVIKKICAAGQIGTPFFYGGKIRVVALGLQDVVSNIPQEFTLESLTYGYRNIKEGTLQYTQKSDEDLVNLLKVTYMQRDPSMTDLFVEQALIFEDQIGMLRAGLALGDTVPLPKKADFDDYGITNLHEALRIGSLVIDLGEQEAGGLKNNLSATFTTFDPSSDGLQLHPWKLIRIRDVNLQMYKQEDGSEFRYFRVTKLRRKGGSGPDALALDVECQGYSEKYYATRENGQFVRDFPSFTTGVFTPRLPVIVPRGDDFVRHRDGWGPRVTRE